MISSLLKRRFPAAPAVRLLSAASTKEPPSAFDVKTTAEGVEADGKVGNTKLKTGVDTKGTWWSKVSNPWVSPKLKKVVTFITGGGRTDDDDDDGNWNESAYLQKKSKYLKRSQIRVREDHCGMEYLVPLGAEKVKYCLVKSQVMKVTELNSEKDEVVLQEANLALPKPVGGAYKPEDFKIHWNSKGNLKVVVTNYIGKPVRPNGGGGGVKEEGEELVVAAEETEKKEAVEGAKKEAVDGEK